MLPVRVSWATLSDADAVKFSAIHTHFQFPRKKPKEKKPKALCFPVTSRAFSSSSKKLNEEDKGEIAKERN